MHYFSYPEMEPFLNFLRLIETCTMQERVIAILPYCKLVPMGSIIGIVNMQYRKEMEEEPYNYYFPNMEDNMRNSSKVWQLCFVK
jgi:hypothetical protein